MTFNQWLKWYALDGGLSHARAERGDEILGEVDSEPPPQSQGVDGAPWASQLGLGQPQNTQK